jgi:hypothetical protein
MRSRTAPHLFARQPPHRTRSTRPSGKSLSCRATARAGEDTWASRWRRTACRSDCPPTASGIRYCVQQPGGLTGDKRASEGVYFTLCRQVAKLNRQHETDKPTWELSVASCNELKAVASKQLNCPMTGARKYSTRNIGNEEIQDCLKQKNEKKPVLTASKLSEYYI